MVATVLPSGASNKTVTWTSATPSVATVSGGLVTGVRTGSSRITVRTTDGGFTAFTTVNVFVGVTGVTLNRATVTLRRGATSKLVATVVPGNAVSKNVTWSSSNTVIATMSSTGIVTARRAGSCVITVRTADGGFTATCAVTVN
jgi:trimeric autotransporter adhesin